LQDPLGFDAGDSSLYRYLYNSPVQATDPSGLVWGIRLGFIDVPQELIQVTTQKGATLVTLDPFIFRQFLYDTRKAGDTISSLIISGHGWQDGIALGKYGDTLEFNHGALAGKGIEIHRPENDRPPDPALANLEKLLNVNPPPELTQRDITDMLRDVTDNRTTICLRGCYTSPLAANLQSTLGNGAKVSGMVGPAIGIPGTGWAIGYSR
jgi:hypothetical protein